MENYESAGLLNIESGEDVTMAELANIVAKITVYNGSIDWDTSKPDGTPKRPLDYSKLLERGWKPKYSLSSKFIFNLTYAH